MKVGPPEQGMGICLYWYRRTQLGVWAYSVLGRGSSSNINSVSASILNVSVSASVILDSYLWFVLHPVYLIHFLSGSSRLELEASPSIPSKSLICCSAIHHFLRAGPHVLKPMIWLIFLNCWLYVLWFLLTHMKDLSTSFS